ncbi:Phenylacetic acid degradation protein PaaD, thioesterase [Rhodovulum sp. P5]|uniref:PaaI family thioesterase n=1 Tax=Rhodovulum sp. P5 TaxID=1564506 RepID=UPI0009C28F06|nr:PaaI family thioesterase [Rhodovulum sp. P5]ARE41926.1 Phenylacetic acid degradation protein PaaD, thioesterase [Rhodovulum sp. P5]
MTFAARNPDFEKNVRESFSCQAIMSTMGAEIVSLEPGKMVVAAPFRKEFSQQFGVAHAGLTFALGDTAAGYAAMSLMPPGHDVMTAEMKIHLMVPGKGQRIVARGEVLKPGRRLFVVRADVFSEDGQDTAHIATLLGTMVPVQL